MTLGDSTTPEKPHVPWLLGGVVVPSLPPATTLELDAEAAVVVGGRRRMYSANQL
jgi:hypothetical protein